MLVLDTHILLWLTSGNERIKNHLEAIDAALAQGELGVSAISWWEIGTLIEKRRLSLPQPLDSWRRSRLSEGLREFPINGDIAIKAPGLKDFHGDPADRIIVATAIEYGASLMTADKKILEWKGTLSTMVVK